LQWIGAQTPAQSQSFVPLDDGPHLVAVAPAGDFDPAKIRLFRAETHQGVHYHKDVWHHFLIVLKESDFLVVHRAGAGDNLEVGLASIEQNRVRLGKWRCPEERPRPRFGSRPMH
jgi:ureidoglycolate hydrolase